MNMDLSEEQLMLKDSVGRFARNEVAPGAGLRDETGEYPWGIMKQLAELNLLGILIPQQYGGAGLDYVSYAVIIEELCRYDAGLGMTVAAHNSLSTFHIYKFGSEELRRRYLPSLAKGEVMGAWALTEPSSGSDAAGLTTTAALRDDRWVLKGRKAFTTNGSVAGIYVIMASTAGDRGKNGISAFVVEANAPGLGVGRKENKLGVRCSDTAGLVLDDVEAPRGNLIGEVNRGFIDCLDVLDGGRIGIAAMALGLARGALEESLSYSREREQFGRPIAEFQATQWKLADMATELDAARLLTYRAALMRQRGEKCTMESAMAKLFASEVAGRAVNHAVQIHGGYGYIKDYPVERFFRDAKICEIGEGTSEVQRMVIARNLLDHTG
jgi:hypothetical protein